MKGVKIIFVLLIFASCSPSTLQEVQIEAKAEMRRLASELKELNCRQEVQKAVPRLRKRYVKMAKLILQAEAWKSAAAGDPSQESEELFIQLARLYEIPGARELIEGAQQEAIALLDRPR